MVLNIDRDQTRFKQIVRGAIRKNLKKYISRGEFIGKKGKDFVSIPVPQIEIPTFRYDHRDVGGVGQGEGAQGTPIGAEPGDGDRGAGDAPGQHVLEAEVQLTELAKILGEELELPRIQPRGKKNIIQEEDRYIGISRVGPDSLRHFKRTYKQALKRQIMCGSYSPERPVIVPIRDDMRFRARKKVLGPTANAVIIYMMDVSGSMEEEQKEIVRIESFWIDTWLRSQYRGIESRYIVHDAVAKEVDEETFYHLRESGGTRISSAYQEAADLIEKNYPVDDWNVYALHFSDGDNLSDGDDELCVELLNDRILPRVNLFGYGQVEGRYGGGKFIDMLADRFQDVDNIAFSRIEDREKIWDSIKAFLGKGR
jgi:uncharacterized sporulation protein YeaH/YhbH (DUF444 family)